ncbi:MAG: hypothetical protein QF425_11405, partial [Dehalococcoidia bacterium]|nr:hypothetical protein [Dehalococcoidia bacterium]
MARIFKRGKKWYVDYRVNGRRIWKSVGTRKELAEDYLKDLEGKRVRGELMDIREVKTANFDDFCVKYLEVYGQNKAESTRARDDVTVNKHLIPFFGLRPLKHITTADIEEYKAQRRTTRRKDRVLADGTVVKGKRIARTTINRELGL